MEYLPILGTLVTGGLFILGFLYSRHSRDYPPVVPAAPIVGGLYKFLKGPVQLMMEQYPKLGPVFTVKLVHKSITILLGPEVSDYFFKAQESELSQKEIYRFNVPTFGPGVVFDVDYPVRMEQFRFFAEALQVKRLKTYVDMMVDEAQDFIAKWGDEGEVNLGQAMEKLIILTASRCLLGPEVRQQLFGEVSKLFHDLDKGMLPISVLLPYLPIPAHRKRDEARKKLADIFAKIIQNRKASGIVGDDMLQSFISSKYKATGRSTTESEVTGLLIAALFAGQHTSSITASWTGAYLISQKKYYDQACQEQKQVMKQHGSGLHHDALIEMTVLHRIIKEALRLHPPLIMLLRYSHSDFSVQTPEGKTYVVPKGHIVATSPHVANRLPHVFKNPDTFDPDRFGPDREEDKAAAGFSYISFGGGRHGCMGETFAYMQVKTIWSVILRNYDLDIVSPFPEIDWTAMVVGLKGNLIARYKRRALENVAYQSS